MKRPVYFTIITLSLIAVACASVLAQDAPPVTSPSFIDRLFANPIFKSSLPIVMAFIISGGVTWAKRFKFVEKHPQPVAGAISIFASIVTESLGMSATTAWGGVIIDSIMQFALTIGAFETVLKKLPKEQKLKAEKAKKRVKKGIYQPDDKTPTAPLN